jgi:hypothetical protein
VAGPGEHDELGPPHTACMASPTATGARTSWSAYSRSVGTSTSGSTWLWSPKLARAIARKPPGRNARALSMDVATSSPSADGENIDGTIAAANSSGGNPDACSERASRCFASSAPSEPRQPASRPGRSTAAQTVRVATSTAIVRSARTGMPLSSNTSTSIGVESISTALPAAPHGSE